MKARRTPVTRKARRRAYLLDHRYRDLGGRGDRAEVAGDIVTDLLHGLPDDAWMKVLRDGLTNALEERHGEGTAPHLELIISGLNSYPEGW